MLEKRRSENLIMPEKLRLLLLSVGSLAAQNVIDALGARRERCVLIGTNSIAEAAGNFRCDTVYLVPPAASGADYIARVREVIGDEHPDLVIPTRDEDVLALAILGEESPQTGAVLLAGSSAAARMWYDKVETAHFARRHDLPFAPTAVNASEALALFKAHPPPIIGKPRCGNASRGVVLLQSSGEIERAFALHPDLLAQPFLDPPPDIDALIAPFTAGLPFFFSFPENAQYLATVVIGPDGALSQPSSWVCKLVGGQSVQGRRCDDPDLLEVTRAYAQAAATEGWRGPVNVQLKRTPQGKLVAFELNGRFGGGTAARTLFGFDEVGEAIRRFLPAANFPPAAVPEANEVQKYLRAYPIPRDGVLALQTSRRWSRPLSGNLQHVAHAQATKLRLLVLSVGSLAAQKLIDALGARRERCVLIGTNSIAKAAPNFRYDKAYRVPSAASGAAYIERIAELIRDECPDLVIPTRDDDVLALAMLGERSPSSHPVLLTGSVAAARIMNDKMQTARFADRHGLPFAPTVDDLLGALDLARTHGLPLIGKPRSGNASRGVVLLRSIPEIERAFELSPGLIAQPLLDPPPELDELIAPFEAGMPFFFSFPETRQYFLQVVVGPDGTVSQAFGTLSTQVGGQAIRSERCNDVELLEIGRAYALAAAAEGWKGPLNVQLKRASAGGLLAHELNGRFSGGTTARAYLGFDEIAEVINRFLPAATFPSIPASECDVVQNYMYTEPLPREGVVALRDAARWSRA